MESLCLLLQTLQVPVVVAVQVLRVLGRVLRLVMLVLVLEEGGQQLAQAAPWVKVQTRKLQTLKKQSEDRFSMVQPMLAITSLHQTLRRTVLTTTQAVLAASKGRSWSRRSLP